MSGADDARALLEAVGGYVDTPPGAAPPSQDRPTRLATVATGSAGTEDIAVIFDGESLAGLRLYRALAPVVAGQRVALIPVGATYVIAGPIEGGGPISTAVVTTSIAVAAEWAGTVRLAKSFVLTSIATDAPARIRIYASAAMSAADASRALYAPYVEANAPLFEATTETGNLAFPTNPEPWITSAADSVDIAIRVARLGGSTGALTVTLGWRP